MVIRKDYLDQLISWKDEDIIKVVTGIRRCGKTTLLNQFQNYLLSNGIDESQIIALNFEELENEALYDYHALYDYLKTKINSSRMNYIFLDEVQRVESFEKVVDSLSVKDYIDIYLTGSNSYMLSSDIATYISGRYVEIKMLPLSFKEFCEANSMDGSKALSEYMKIGGLPYITIMDRSPEKIRGYLEGIYNTVIVKDIEDRQRRIEADKNKRKITDIVLLKTISKFLSSVVGSPVSVKSVTDYLTSNGRKVSPNTVNDYINALTESFIFYEVDRFDIVGKEILKTNKKYYIVDLGLRNFIISKRNFDLDFSLENIVYLELIRRNYAVNIGKLGDKEVDFVACKNDEYIYIQVTADMTDEKTFEREIAPLKSINDNYRKIILTLDNYTVGNYEGVEVINVLDWL